jgi:hypothetical protein
MNTKPEALPIVAYRARFRSEPGMIGHYPWSYMEAGRAHLRAELEYEALTDHAQATSQLSALQEEVEGLRADAMRYRWLRDEADPADWEYIGWQSEPATTDAAIDQARLALKVGSDTLKGE